MATSQDEIPTMKQKRSEILMKQLDGMSPEEQTRYEFFSRSHFNRAVIKGIMSQSIGPIAPSDEMVIVVSSLSKAFVGDLVEEALEVQRCQGQSGSLSPDQIMEAFRRLRKQGKMDFRHRPSQLNSNDSSPWSVGGLSVPRDFHQACTTAGAVPTVATTASEAEQSEEVEK